MSSLLTRTAAAILAPLAEAPRLGPAPAPAAHPLDGRQLGEAPSAARVAAAETMRLAGFSGLADRMVESRDARFVCGALDIARISLLNTASMAVLNLREQLCLAAVTAARDSLLALAGDDAAESSKHADAVLAAAEEARTRLA